MKPSSLLSHYTGLAIASACMLSSTVARAEFLPDDIHWHYTYGGPSKDRAVLNLRHVAKWEDGAWKSLGSGVGTTGSQIINCIALGRENDLFVGGTFNEGHKNAGSAKYQFARWHPDRDFTDYEPGALDNITGRFFQLEDGRLQYTLTGRTGTNYQMEASNDLVNWVPVTDAVFNGESVRDGFNLRAPTVQTRYYRYSVAD